MDNSITILNTDHVIEKIVFLGLIRYLPLLLGSNQPLLDYYQKGCVLVGSP